MNIADFNQLNLRQREAEIWKQGRFLAVRYQCGFKMVLYSIGKFFAEIIYLDDDNRILCIKTYNNGTYLEPYLEMVDISDLRR